MDPQKVAVICYSYSDGFAYMEQKLAKAFVDLGMKVLVICSTANRVDSKNVVRVKKGEYESEGYSVCRLPFIMGGHLPNHRMPIILKGMYTRLVAFEPDIIYHMSCSAINLLSVRKYMKKHPETALFVDNHAALSNSANNYLSKVILHKVIYKTIAQRVDKYVKKYFYIGPEEKEFLEGFYHLSKEKCYFFSLGDFVPEDALYLKERNHFRNSENLTDSQIVITYSGKFTQRKKTIEILQFMVNLLREDNNIHFYLIGSVEDDTIAEQFNKLVNQSTPNFTYLGWKSSEDLKRILCGTDIYIQYEPSVTFQTALCCRAYGITGTPNGAYSTYPDDVFKKVETVKEIENHLRDVIHSGTLQTKKEITLNYARVHLDYRNQIQELILEK